MKTATPPLKVVTAPEVQRQRLLNRVAALYHQSFQEDSKGRDYLAQVGLKEISVLDDFQTGWVNGTLLATIPEESELQEHLKALGLLDDQGREVLAGCVVFPWFNETGDCAGLYGLRVETAESSLGARPRIRCVELPSLEERPGGVSHFGHTGRLVSLPGRFQGSALDAGRRGIEPRPFAPVPTARTQGSLRHLFESLRAGPTQGRGNHGPLGEAPAPAGGTFRYRMGLEGSQRGDAHPFRGSEEAGTVRALRKRPRVFPSSTGRGATRSRAWRSPRPNSR